MFNCLNIRPTTALACIATSLSLSGIAKADSSADRILEKMAALEARVAALESKNREYKRDADEARTQAKLATEKLSKLSGAVPNNVASAMAYKAGPNDHPALVSWTGVYWGASAGGAATRSKVISAERNLQAFSNTVTGYDILGNSSASNGFGGLIDLFAGWNIQISRAVVGAQIEATASDLNLSSSGSKTNTYFNAAGPIGLTAAGDFRPQVASRSMASALLRAGVLLDDNTLAYGLGGWTGSQFETRNVTDSPFNQPVETFWANGWTAGGGIERKLDSSWSVRAEYRYTDFGTSRTNDHFLFTAGPPPSAQTQTSDRQTSYSQSMQSGRIGFAYAFNPLR